MKNVLILSFAVFLLVSCRKEYTIELHTDKDYGVMIKNSTHDSIYVQCDQFSTPSLMLVSQEESKPMFTEKKEIEVKWFGKGTYYKQKEKTFLLQKNEIVTLELKSE